MSLAWKIPVIAALALLAGIIVQAAWPMPRRQPEPRQQTMIETPPPAGPQGAGKAGAPGSTRKLTRPEMVSPEEALAAALSIRNRQRRLAEVSRLLKEWAARSPAAAFEWAHSQPEETRRTWMIAALTSAGGQPQAEFALGLMLKAHDAEEADELGLAVIQALNNEKHFEAAIQFANSLSSAALPDWLASIFRAWGTREPRAALLALESVDPVSRPQIFQALAQGWADCQPADLGNYAIALPPGEERANALATLFDRWSLQDPEQMAGWLAGIPRTPELDPAVAAMILRSDGANRPTALALEWAETLFDPKLRFAVAEHLLREWMPTDPNAALTYVRSASWLTPAQRNELSQIITAPAPLAKSAED